MLWKTLVFQIDEAAWTVDSGSWEGLVKNVTLAVIDTDILDGDGTIGIDNFGRQGADCPLPDYPLQSVDGALVACAHYGLGAESGEGIKSVALNPVDGELYGLLRAAPDAGGGIYAVTGPSAGSRLSAFDRPWDLLFDALGNAFISEDYDGEIHRYSAEGISELWLSGFHSGDDDPTGISFAPVGFDGPNVSAGDLVILDRGKNGADEIWSCSSTTAQTGLLLTPDTPGDTDWTSSTAGDGVIYVVDSSDPNNLYSLDASGAMTPLALDAPIDSANAVVYDSSTGHLYVASATTQALYRVEPDTGSVTQVLTGFSELAHCALGIDADTGRLWIADEGYQRVYEFCL